MRGCCRRSADQPEAMARAFRPERCRTARFRCRPRCSRVQLKGAGAERIEDDLHAAPIVRMQDRLRRRSTAGDHGVVAGLLGHLAQASAAPTGLQDQDPRRRPGRLPLLDHPYRNGSGYRRGPQAEALQRILAHRCTPDRRVVHQKPVSAVPGPRPVHHFERRCPQGNVSFVPRELRDLQLRVRAEQQTPTCWLRGEKSASRELPS